VAPPAGRLCSRGLPLPLLPHWPGSRAGAQPRPPDAAFAGRLGSWPWVGSGRARPCHGRRAPTQPSPTCYPKSQPTQPAASFSPLTLPASTSPPSDPAPPVSRRRCPDSLRPVPRRLARSRRSNGVTGRRAGCLGLRSGSGPRAPLPHALSGPPPAKRFQPFIRQNRATICIASSARRVRAGARRRVRRSEST